MVSPAVEKNTTPDAGAVKKKLLTVEEWFDYAQKGIDLPVTTLLYGGSMEPLIRYKKDPVTIIPLKRELLPGDIVLFRRQDGAFVVHRFYRDFPGGLWVQTWGDNCKRPDQPIAKSAVIGLVVSMEKDGETIILDCEEQREYGVKTMRPTFARSCRFFCKDLRQVARRAYKGLHIGRLFKK